MTASRAFSSSAALALLLAAASPARSASTETGTIRLVDPAAKVLTIQPEAGAELTFVLQDDTRVREHGHAIAIRDLRPGQRVMIRLIDQGDRLVAQRIDVIDRAGRT